MIEHKIDIKFIAPNEEPVSIKATMAMAEDSAANDDPFETANSGGCFDLTMQMEDDSVTLRGNRNEFIKLLKFMESNSTF